MAHIQEAAMRGKHPSDRSRREFARLFALGGSAALFTSSPAAWRQSPAARPAGPSADERYWAEVRAGFVMPDGFACLNAANLCPSPARVLDAYFESTRSVDRDPSPQNRRKTRSGREATRRALATYLRVTPEEIVITRNTSESNNFVSSGLDLKAGDEVLIFSDNHPSNHAAWRQKAERFGFTIRTVDHVSPHPGADYYVDAFKRQMTARTRVVAFTHVTASVGDLLPARELCQMAREHGALSLVDGAQSFGVLDVDLSTMQPDFYTGSAHKWPCGPKECGVLFVSRRAHDRIKPTIVSLYPGEVGISRTMEAFGQRDEPAIVGFGEALALQTAIGREAIGRRSTELAQMLIDGLRRIDGVRVWTPADPARSAGIVSFQPASLDERKLHQALYEMDRITCATRPGSDRGGLRFSPHFYNLETDIERAVDAVRKYVSRGL
jgi:selenocysteine lyase/cysteine desulfurase